jgi:arylsulfatase A-like enzyme
MRTNTTAVTPAGTMFETYSERDWRIYRWVYARLTEAVDTQIGRILSTMRRNPDTGGTVVIFVSDHGNMHANHGLASKGVFYEESIRVPFIIADDGLTAGRNAGRNAGRIDTETLVNTGLDIVPTCCDYAGVPAPDGCIGTSVRPAVEGGNVPSPRSYVAAENGNGRMIRSRRYKYTVYEGLEEGPALREILTDLESDPGELRNLAVDDASGDTLREHRRMMRQWFETTNDEGGLRDFVVPEAASSTETS